MKKLTLLLALAGFALAGCKHDREPNKIVDGLPFKVEETVMPAYAVQHLILLTKDSLRSAVTVLNKTSILNANYSDVTNISSNTYQFSLSNVRYGTAVFTIQFFDEAGAGLDPILNQVSSATIKSMALNVTSGSSSLFTYTATSLLTLDIAGDVSSTLRSTGTYTFTGQGAATGYSVAFVQPAPGSRTAFEGFKDGAFTATGNGPAGIGTVSMNLAVSSNHGLGGSLTWEGQSGGIQLENNGTGFVITSQARIPIE
jgi:hypothetical protein